MNPNYVVLGAGGHARVLIECIIAGGGPAPAVVLDQDSSSWGTQIQGVTIEGGDDLLSSMLERGINYFAVGVGSIESSKHRAELFDRAVLHGLSPLTVKHPTAICSRWAEIGAGAQLFPGSIVNAGAQVGANVIVNSGAIIEHDCIVGAHAHVATGAKLSGGVIVGAGVHIGAGATIKQSINIGDNAVVGAGAVVVKDVPANVIVVGVPAEIMRAVNQTD